MLTMVLLLVSGGTAGEYHSGSTLICSDCHTMHASQQHDYAGVAGVQTWNAGVGFSRLLKASNTNLLCLTCHDGQTGIPDVIGADFNTTESTAGGRSAGALNSTSIAAGATAGYLTWTGHTLETPPASVTPPGQVGAITFTCASCHQPHGTANYRNLVTAVTYTVQTTTTNAFDVRINLAAIPGAGSRVSGGFYSSDNIVFNEVGATASPYGAFCASCHGTFHGTANTMAVSPYVKHPTAAVDFPAGYVTQYNAKTNKARVIWANNVLNPTVTTTATPSCMSCHRAHGNKNPFGLIYMASAGTRNEEGVAGGTLRDLCGQCHVYGN